MKKLLIKIAGVLLSLAVVTSAVTIVWRLRAQQRTHDAFEALRSAGLPAAMDDIERPAVDPGENAAPLYVAACKLARPLRDISRSDLSRDISPDVRGILEQAEPAFALLRRAAELPHCIYSQEAPEGANCRIDFTTLGKLGRGLWAQALVHSEQQNLQEAAHDLHALFRLGRSLRETPSLLGQLVRMSIAEMRLAALEAVLPRLQGTPWLQVDVELDDVQGATALAMRQEVACLADGLRTEAWRQAEVLESLPAWMRISFLAGPYLAEDMAFVLDVHRRRLLALGGSYPRALDAWKSLSLEMATRGGAVAAFQPRIDGILAHEAKTASRSELARVAVRCLEYRRSHGAFPRELNDLGEPVPVPCALTARPFEIVREGGTVYLVSTGEPSIRWSLGDA